MPKALSTLAALVLAGCAATVPPLPAVSAAVGEGTRVLDRAGLDRLIANKGVTLQWLGWNQRATAHVRWQGDELLLTAAQAKSGVTGAGGRLFVDGVVEEIGRDYFTFVGTISIEDTPDAGRRCEATRNWRFAITQNRPYWRLREFEWCDGLTDYIDIYF